jgi:hypothetical protein
MPDKCVKYHRGQGNVNKANHLHDKETGEKENAVCAVLAVAAQENHETGKANSRKHNLEKGTNLLQ